MCENFATEAMVSVGDFYRYLSGRKINRAYIAGASDGQTIASHGGLLELITDSLIASKAYAGHEAIFFERSDKYQTVYFAFIHNTNRGLAQGGLRFASYSLLRDLLRDGLRLSQGMTRKNALANLWWGGGKGILPVPDNRPELLSHGKERELLFEAYGRFVASLGGVYYTAEDAGTSTPDMDSILRTNRFVTCVSPEFGGSGNPSPLTARGVIRAMSASWGVLTGSGSLRGVHVAIQGVGNVGFHLALLLQEQGARITVADLNAAALRKTLAHIPEALVVDASEILSVNADILAPCALGAQVNNRTVPHFKVRLICGAANNILDTLEDAAALRGRGITFVPDFVANRMGIVNCADEWKGVKLEKEIDEAIEKIGADVEALIKDESQGGGTAFEVAVGWADRDACLINQTNPNRGRDLIENLLHKGWISKGGSHCPVI